MRAFSSVLAGLVAGAGILILHPLLLADHDGQKCIADLAPANERRDACTFVLARRLLPEDRARTLAYRGAALLGMGKEDEALADFTQALAITPDLVMALLDRSLVHARREQYDAALADLAAVFRAGGDLTDAWAARGYLYFQHGNLVAAAADIERLQESDPENAWAHNISGAIHAQLGDFPKAAAEYRRAVALAPDDPGFADDISRFELGHTP